MLAVSSFMPNMYFNSIKVQLEPEILEKNGWKDEFQFHKGTIRTQSSHGACKIHFSFQFHKGTIRTYILPFLRRQLCEFQFHKGTIRTANRSTLSSLQRHFNSIKVQLEPSYVNSTFSRKYFNSIKVQLELKNIYTHPCVLSHFNSIKVQLELVIKDNDNNDDYFNSIKVQLELAFFPSLSVLSRISIP